MNTAKTCNLTSDDRYSAILSDCRAAMEGLRAPEGAIQEYLDRVAGVLDGLVKHCGDGVEVRYNVSTRFKKTFLKIETDMLMFSSLGLNLSDQYWFKPAGASLSWRDVNFFENDFMATRPRRSPDSSTPGALEKWWEKRGERNWLLKASSTAEEREPYNELLATRLCDRLLDAGEFVPYELEEHDGRACSACPTLATPETEFVSAHDVATYFGITEGRDLYRGYVRACDELGIRDARAALAKMMVCDHVMANFDRHRANFGLIRNVDTLDGWRIAPLFDNGAAFFSRATVAELRRERYTWTSSPFEEYPLAQLARVEDLSWYDPDMLAGFDEEVRQVLGSNPHLSDEAVSRMARHVQRNIDAVNDLYVERAR